MGKLKEVATKRNAHLHIKLTKHQKAFYQAFANRLGCTLTDLVEMSIADYYANHKGGN